MLASKVKDAPLKFTIMIQGRVTSDLILDLV